MHVLTINDLFYIVVYMSIKPTRNRRESICTCTPSILAKLTVGDGHMALWVCFYVRTIALPIRIWV